MTGANSLQEIGFLLRLIKPLWKKGILVLCLTVCTTLLSALMPLSIKVMIDFIIMKGSTESIEYFLNTLGLSSLAPVVLGIFTSVEYLIGGILVIAALAGIMIIAQQYLVASFQHRAVFQIQRQLFEHVLRFPLSFFRNTDTGYMMARISEDIQIIQSFFSEIIPYMAGRIVNIGAVLIILGFLNLKLTVLILLLVPLYLILSSLLSTRLRNVSYEERERYATVLKGFKEVLSGVETVKAYTAESSEVAKVADDINRALTTRKRRIIFTTLSVNSMRIFQLILGLAIMFIGFYEIKDNRMTVGDYAAFVYYIFYISGSVSQLAVFHMMLQPIMASASRIRELFELFPEDTDGIILKDPKGEIIFKNVTFSYVPDKEVLRDIDFRINPSETVVISGPTGSGKTTLVNLLLKFYTPDKGDILIDGYSIERLHTTWLREQIGILSQDVFLFNDTVKNNIKYGRMEATEEEIIEAAQMAGIHEEVLAMPEGYNTIVGDRGVRLSMGQRQRIALARVFLRNPRILILDEPTASVDQKTEETLKEAFKKLLKSRTAIIITHRPSLMEMANRIFELKDGRLKEVK